MKKLILILTLAVALIPPHLAQADLSALGNSGAGVNSVNGQVGDAVLDSDDVSEGSTNLYHTTARGKSAALAALSDVKTQEIYVDKNRTDSYTEDGSFGKPYKTLEAAYAAITDAGDLKRYVIKPAPGLYTMVAGTKFKPWVELVGTAREAVRVAVASGNMVADCTGSTSRMVFKDVTISGPLVVDKTGATGGCWVNLDNVQVTGAFTYTGTGSGVDFLRVTDSDFSSSATINSVSVIFNRTNVYGAMTLSTSAGTNADAYGYQGLFSFQGSYVAGNLSVTAATGKNGGVQLFQTMGDGGWTFTGTATLDMYIDGSSGPFQGNTFTKTGTVNTYRYGHPSNIYYNPVSANWTATVPTNVKDALDKIASGDYSTQGVRLATSGAKPTCNSSNRGRLWLVQGAAGVADDLQVCKKDAADAYSWVSL